MSYPELGDLVPHSGPMLLLREVCEHDAEQTTCTADPTDSRLFLDDHGVVPAWVGLEYMAQCAAVHGGLVGRAAGESPRAGLLLGTRKLELAADCFRPGQQLRVSARRVHAGSQMLSFACEILDDQTKELLASARINVYLLADGPEG